MALFSRLIGGLRGLFQKNQVEQDLDDELHDYLESVAEEKVSSGMSQHAAVRAARVELGSVEAVKDRVRDVGWETVAESVWQDVRFAFRILRKRPAFTAAAVATLALGVGGTTAVFSVVDGLFLRAPVGASAPESLRRLYIKRDAGYMQTPDGGPGLWIDYVAMRHSGPALNGIGAYLSPELVDLGRGAEVEQVRASVVSHDFLAVLGIPAALGRFFIAEDDGVAGAHPVAVISHAMWQTRFGGAADAVGKPLLINGVLLEIVGVTEKGFTGVEADGVDVWLPSSMAAPLGLERADGDWRRSTLAVRYIARLASAADDAIAMSQAAESLRRIADAELESHAGSSDVSSRAGGSESRDENCESVSVVGACCGSRPDHCVRERGQPVARPSDYASTRAGCSFVARGGGVARREATSDRERGAGCVGRCRRRSGGVLGDGTDAAVSPTAVGRTHRRATTDVRTGGLAADRHPLWYSSRDSRRAGRSGTGAEGLARRRRAQTKPPAAGVGHGPDGRVAGTPRRRRVVRPVTAPRKYNSQRCRRRSRAHCQSRFATRSLHAGDASRVLPRARYRGWQTFPGSSAQRSFSWSLSTVGLRWRSGLSPVNRRYNPPRGFSLWLVLDISNPPNQASPRPNIRGDGPAWRRAGSGRERSHGADDRP